MATHGGEDDPWAELVVSVLSVNNYSLEKTYAAFDRLKDAGIFDPKNLDRWELSEITKRLHEAGYNRGPFMMNIFAERLAALGRFAASHGIEACETVLRGTDAARIEGMLTCIKGIGPRVLENFFLLMGITRA